MSISIRDADRNFNKIIDYVETRKSILEWDQYYTKEFLSDEDIETSEYERISNRIENLEEQINLMECILEFGKSLKEES